MKIDDLEFAVPGLFDLLVIASEKLGEIHLIRALDIWHEQVSRTVLFLDVDCNAEVYVFVFESRRGAVHDAEAKIHLREDLNSRHYRPRNDVCEGDFAVTLCGEMLVNDAAIFFEDLDRNVAKARRRRDGEALLHIFDDLFSDACNRFWLSVSSVRNRNRSFR